MKAFIALFPALCIAMPLVKNLGLVLTFIIASGCAVLQTEDTSAGTSESMDTAGPPTASEALSGPVVQIMLETKKEFDQLIASSKSFTGLRQTMARNGYIATEARTIPKLKQSIKNGTPAVVALAGERTAVVIGMELRDEVFTLKRSFGDNAPTDILTRQELFAQWKEAGFRGYAFSEWKQLDHSFDRDNIFKQALAIEKTAPQKAAQILRRLIYLDDASADYFAALAKNVANRNPREAVYLLTRAIELAPNRFELWHNLAATQALAGMRKASLQTAGKTVEMFKDSTDFQERLERLKLLTEI